MYAETPQLSCHQMPSREKPAARGDPAKAMQDPLWHVAPAANLAGTMRQLAGPLLKIEGSPQIETMAETAGLSVRWLPPWLADDRT